MSRSRVCVVFAQLSAKHTLSD